LQAPAYQSILQSDFLPVPAHREAWVRGSPPEEEKGEAFQGPP